MTLEPAIARLMASKLGACRTCMALSGLMLMGSAAAFVVAARIGFRFLYAASFAVGFAVAFAAAHAAMFAFRRLRQAGDPDLASPCGCGSPGRTPLSTAS